MKMLGRRIVFGAMVCAAIGVLTFAIFSRTQKVVADQKESGQWVDPANPSDELVDGPYKVDPNWPKPLAELFPEEKGWTWGAVQGIFAQNPDRVFVAMRGELPDLSHIKPTFVEVETDYGLKTHLQVPVVGLVSAERIGGTVCEPGRSGRRLQGH